MKTFDEVDVNTPLSIEDFCTLFSPLPLTEEEKIEVGEGYYRMYQAFLGADVNPLDSWIATRNVFAIKNQQIAERIKLNKSE